MTQEQERHLELERKIQELEEEYIKLSIELYAVLDRINADKCHRLTIIKPDGQVGLLDVRGQSSMGEAYYLATFFYPKGYHILPGDQTGGNFTFYSSWATDAAQEYIKG